MSKRFAWLVMGCVAFLGLWACGGTDGGTDTAVPADTAAEATAPDSATPDSSVPDMGSDLAVDDLMVEAETHATPQPSQLTSAHAGWKNATCMTCHTYDVHNDGSDPYLCAGCHGTNGAPTPPHGDKDKCSTCHGAPHGAEGFPDPLACRACHLP